MVKYSAIFAADVGCYGTFEFEAENDEAARDAAGQSKNFEATVLDPQFDNIGNERIVVLENVTTGEVIDEDVALVPRYISSTENLNGAEAPNIVIELDGGIVRQVWINGQPTAATVYDYDVEGSQPDEVAIDKNGREYCKLIV